MTQSTRFGYRKQTLKINYIDILGRQPMAVICQSVSTKNQHTLGEA